MLRTLLFPLCNIDIQKIDFVHIWYKGVCRLQRTFNLNRHQTILGVQFAYLGTYVLFVDQPLVSLSLYNRATQLLMGLTISIYPLPFENVGQESVIIYLHFYAFPSEVHIWHKFDNIFNQAW